MRRFLRGRVLVIRWLTKRHSLGLTPVRAGQQRSLDCGLNWGLANSLPRRRCFPDRRSAPPGPTLAGYERSPTTSLDETSPGDDGFFWDVNPQRFTAAPAR